MAFTATTEEYLFVPLRGPKGVDLTQYAADLALVPDNGSEPASGDWHAGTWLAPEAGAAAEVALLIGAPNGQVYAAGSYMVFARLTAGSERPVVRAGRWRIG